MSNPKQVYINIDSKSKVTDEWYANDRRIHKDDLVYRLVDPNEQSKIERIEKRIYQVISDNGDDCDFKEFHGLRLALKIMNHVNNESEK